MVIRLVKRLFFYFFFSCVLYHPITAINFVEFINTYISHLIKTGQKSSILYEYSIMKNKSTILLDYSEKNSTFNNQYLAINKRKKRKIVKYTNEKWDFPIVYEIEKNKFNETLIDEVIKTIQNETCIQFAKRNKTYKSNQPVLKYFLGTTCVSYYGRQRLKDVQGIFLQKACQNWRHVIHETLHALGLIHEQARYDRDNYVTINWGNIIRGCEKNFNIFNSVLTSTYNLSYDYGSVMHYNAYSWSKNNAITIAPKDNIYLSTLGSSKTASFNDFKVLNVHYCQGKCKKTIPCDNGSYQSPNNCQVCKCPDGFQGTLCRVKSKGKDKCGKSYTAVDSVGEITVNNSKECIYHINASENNTIDINLFDITFSQSLFCNPNNCLEIKYKKDLTITGARICKKLNNYILKSESSHVIIFYRSTKDSNSAKILFRISKNDNSPWITS